MTYIHHHFNVFTLNTLKLILDIDIIGIIKKYYVELALNVLAIKNKHRRDREITFHDEGHIYDLIHPVMLSVCHPISVTTLIHEYCQEFKADLIIYRMMNSKRWSESKYFGKTKYEIKDQWEKDRNEAADAGTKMHFDIELYMNGYEDVNNQSVEFTYFKHFWMDFKNKYPEFKPYRTEMLIWDENFREQKGICGSVDMILKDDKDHVILLDWKRSKEIKFENAYQKMAAPFNNLDDTNYSHYCLQLSIYKYILEMHYHMIVVDMMLVILHPNQTDYHCIPIQAIDMHAIWDKL